MATQRRVSKGPSGGGKGTKVTKEVLSVNLSGVEAGRRRKRVIPEGDYHAILDKAYGHKFNPGSRGVVWEFVIESEDQKANGARFFHNSVFIDKDGDVMTNNLWSLRAVLQAFSPKIKIPDSLVEIPLKKLIGRHVALTIIDGEDDKGETRSEIYEVYNEDELVEADEDEDEDEEEEDEEEEDEDDEEEEDEEDEEEVDLDEDEL